MTRLTPLLLVLCALCGPAHAADRPAPSEPIALWPGDAPGEKVDVGEEVNKSPGDPVIRLTNVTRPTITVFRPAKEKETGAAVLVCPGGGYNILAWNKEGTDIWSGSTRSG